MLSLADVKKAIREPYAWPGGYPLYAIMTDGDTCSIEGLKQDWRNVVEAHLHADRRSGFAVAAIAVNWEDTTLICAITNKTIESAYGESE
jgi:hypothetical protein